MRWHAEPVKLDDVLTGFGEHPGQRRAERAGALNIDRADDAVPAASRSNRGGVEAVQNLAQPIEGRPFGRLHRQAGGHQFA